MSLQRRFYGRCRISAMPNVGAERRRTTRASRPAPTTVRRTSGGTPHMQPLVRGTARSPIGLAHHKLAQWASPVARVPPNPTFQSTEVDSVLPVCVGKCVPEVAHSARRQECCTSLGNRPRCNFVGQRLKASAFEINEANVVLGTCGFTLSWSLDR